MLLGKLSAQTAPSNQAASRCDKAVETGWQSHVNRPVAREKFAFPNWLASGCWQPGGTIDCKLH